jgi:hypothetical protein
MSHLPLRLLWPFENYFLFPLRRILWRIDPLLGGDCKQQPLLGNSNYIKARNNRTAAMKPVSKQRIGKHGSTTIE